MDNLTLAKVIMAILMLEFALTVCVPVENNNNDMASSTKIKRSPSDNISFFGLGRKRPFSLTNPILRAQQSLSNFGSIFTPLVGSRHTINENVHKPIDPHSNIDNAKPRNNLDIINSTEDNDGITKNEVNQKDSGNDSGINENKNLMHIDKELIDSIFKNEIYVTSTTEDITTDYTTETGDYETSTGGDDLLRIPAQAVASLLG